MSSSLTPTSTPHAIPFNSRHLYAAADKCIYCGALVSDGKLGDEHIIPTSFGGNLILPRASCRNCERITTKIKDHCLKGPLEHCEAASRNPRSAEKERADARAGLYRAC
jgi:5-methylcytosine-specific restriction endonuclease McrA